MPAALVLSRVRYDCAYITPDHQLRDIFVPKDMDDSPKPALIPQFIHRLAKDSLPRRLEFSSWYFFFACFSFFFFFVVLKVSRFFAASVVQVSVFSSRCFATVAPQVFKIFQHS